VNILYIRKRIKKLLKNLFYGAGTNSNTIFGDDFQSSYPTPTQLGSDTNWLKISGKSHSYQNVNSVLALKSDGTLWAWGDNNNNQLGLGDTTFRAFPVQVGTDTDWTDVDLGNRISVALKSDGTLWAWGFTLGLNVPTQYGTDNDWEYISAGENNAWATKENGTAYGIGENGSNQLGDGWLSSAESHVLMNPDEDYKYVTILRNNFSPSASSTAIIKNDGTLWETGRSSISSNLVYNFTKIGTDEDWSSISIGGSSFSMVACAIKEDGTLWTWGNNSYGQLGHGDTNDRNTPTKVGTDNDWEYAVVGSVHILAIKQDGTLWASGYNTDGRLGLGDTNDRNTFTQVGTDDDWVYVDASSVFGVAIKSNGTLWAWGGNSNGQLGDGTTTQRTSPVQVGSNTNWSFVSAGSSHCLGLRSDGTLWAWGSNSSGRLGDGTTTQRTSPVQIGSGTDWVSVSAGVEASMATKSNGTLWGWGSDSWYSIGIGGNFTNVNPIQVGSATNWTSVLFNYGNHIGIVENTNGKEFMELVLIHMDN